MKAITFCAVSITTFLMNVAVNNSCQAKNADSLRALPSHVRMQFTSGWSKDYYMGAHANSYPKDGFAWATSSGMDCGLAMGRHLTFYCGLRYNSCVMWDSDVDSSLYSSTGLVLYKDCKYGRSNLGLRIGLGGTTKAGKVFVAPEISVSRRFYESIIVQDYIDNSRSRLDVDGAPRGNIFSLSLSIGYPFGHSLAFWAGYSLRKSTERIEVPQPNSATAGYSFSLGGTFHSVNAAITYTFK